jgi:1,4-alpha-glucan branching enzyme
MVKLPLIIMRRYFMPKPKLKTAPKKRRVTFSFEAPKAKSVILMGDFNHWDAKRHPMKKDSKGRWNKNVMLFPGRYEYRFIVDGKWQNDPHNEQTCPNCYGSNNNYLIIEPK